MTTKLDSPLMPAQNPTKPTTATGTGEGVMVMAVFESRKGRSRTVRAWDELSGIGREALLESMRQRRKAEEQQRQMYTAMFSLRSNR
ncbi:hypothetical protein [Aeromicrobium sp.]|uniref:hypothetical protein n=1 Tax=Aeromicrobium sp. TaxID=1871063 RepID=UPI0019B3306F|nr:hypothetical protein [Aeromicrobium sp.]MBC7633153.1 hypothetical protein [Aeromicrobium sp.]